MFNIYFPSYLIWLKNAYEKCSESKDEGRDENNNGGNENSEHFICESVNDVKNYFQTRPYELRTFMQSLRLANHIFPYDLYM